MMDDEHETTRHGAAGPTNDPPPHHEAVRTRVSRWTRAAAVALLAVAPAADACPQRTPTPKGYLGPHDFTTAPKSNELWREGDRGEQLVLSLRVLDTCGKPLPGARVQLLHADADGAHVRGRYRAILETDTHGAVNVLTVVPGYAGELAGLIIRTFRTFLFEYSTRWAHGAKHFTLLAPSSLESPGLV